MKDYLTKYKGLLHGADYNPDQWLDYPEILEQDIEYMKKSHCNVNWHILVELVRT